MKVEVDVFEALEEISTEDLIDELETRADKHGDKVAKAFIKGNDQRSKLEAEFETADWIAAQDAARFGDERRFFDLVAPIVRP